MAECIHDYAIRRPEERPDHRDIGCIARTKGDRRLRPLEGCQILLHLLVLVGCSREQAGSAGARSVLLDSLNGCTVDARVTDQAQIVVGGQHQHGVAVCLHLWPGPRLQRNLERIGVRIACHAVVSNSRRPRASIKSLLPNFQFLTEEKYPSKSWPEEEGKLTVFPFHTVHFGRNVHRCGGLGSHYRYPFCSNKLLTSEHCRETKAWSLLTSNQQGICMLQNACASLVAFGHYRRAI